MSKTKESLNEWTSSLMQEIPQMLVKLLDQKNGESIERLQLVDVEISLGKKNQGETISQLKRYSSANNNFIHVCSFIYDHSLDIRIAYFVRGQKKFYQPTAQMSQQFLWEAWMSIDRAWVHNALKDAGQENSALSSLELAQLYGRKDIQIPSQLVLFLLIKEALEAWPKNKDSLEYFHVTFFKGLELDRPLEKSNIVNDKDLELAIRQDGQVTTCLKAWVQ